LAGPGSSPHTRGAPSSAALQRCSGGIIPAYAGSTKWHDKRQTWNRDHPRIRGEHTVTGGDCRRVLGSSPHTRGALAIVQFCPFVRGIIPAYAGSTLERRFQCPPVWDHPRIRGEHFKVGTTCKHGRGSSPHTRGARKTATPRSACRGIIPAYAGSTQ